MTTRERDIAIVGAAECDLGDVPDKSTVQLMGQAVLRALDDAGLTLKDVDGVFAVAAHYYMPSFELSEYLGLHPRYIDSTPIGGSAVISMLEHASAAIREGLCDVAVITFASTQRSDSRRVRQQGTTKVKTRLEGSPYELPFGPLFPLSSYALAAQAHMHRYGTTSEQLAEIAVATRKWASLNPKAFKREPITIEDVLNSGVVSSPLQRLDSCLVTDGGGAIVVTSAERARSLRKPPVWVLGTGTAIGHLYIHQMPDLTRTVAGDAATLAFRRAGVTHADIDVVEIYDSFTITVLLALEDLGFCDKGEGGAFVSNQRTAPGGEFPLNTSGGGLSYCHPGLFGILLLVEAVRQVRGEAGERQVPDVQLALAHGIGGVLSSHATAILGRD